MKIILVILTTILTSFYFFPFEFVFMPGINTKMAMAGVGLVCFIFDMARGRKGVVDKDFLILSLIAVSLTMFSLVAMTYNNTQDGSFLTYFVSMYVWLGGAYTAVTMMRKVHGYVSVELVCNYLIAVCVAQCVIAYSMTLLPTLKNIIDGFLGGEDAFMGKAGDRMYGIGAALDVAGARFSAVLVMIAYLSATSTKTNDGVVIVYVAAFFVISVIGNMMARTTTVGLVIALLFLIINAVWPKKSNGRYLFWKWFGVIACIVVPIIVFKYNIDPVFKENIRFGFEGFFSFVETGKWQTSSNDILINKMLVFPETFKTWLIGDGYGANPSSDPYYVGPNFHGFYMGTDIGYLRFIFYFGLGGLVALVSFITYAAVVCGKRFANYRKMFFLILCVNLIVWMKVSTDIFLVLAIFLCISKEETDTYEKQYEDSIPDSLDI